MAMCRARFVFAVLVLLAVPLETHGNDDPEFDSVTCGSVLKLRHVASGVRLHSHDIKYGNTGGGSGQQSVTGQTSEIDANSLWRVEGHAGKQCSPGSKVKCGDRIRLIHVNTGAALHSHSGFVSPLTKQQEVSCLGDYLNFDQGDDWVVECVSRGSTWQRSQDIRLKHASTSRYLFHDGRSVYRRPIANQREVCGSTSNNRMSHWQAEQGLFRKPDSAPGGASTRDEL
eukprot:m.76317 g.76317  ORF g.76317 m.76317 type:complete len:228 (-) comp14507_c2_seq1:2236-2919(-)